MTMCPDPAQLLPQSLWSSLAGVYQACAAATSRREPPVFDVFGPNRRRGFAPKFQLQTPTDFIALWRDGNNS